MDVDTKSKESNSDMRIYIIWRKRVLERSVVLDSTDELAM